MRTTQVAITSLLLLAMAGCTPSLHPIYRDEDIVYEPALVGTFAQKKDKDTWRFEKDADNAKAYIFTHTDNEGRAGRFRAILCRVRGEYFLDLFPIEQKPELRINGLLALDLVPTHMFFHVKQVAPSLQMRTMDPGWLGKYLAGHPKELAHERTDDDRIVITASTPDLQLFFTQHLETEGAYGKFSTYERRTAEPAPKD